VRILLTGAYGFIGRNLVDYFHSQNIFIASLTTNTITNPKLSFELRARDYEALTSEIKIINKIQELQIDTLIHSAAITNQSVNQLELHEANVALTSRVAHLAIQSNIERFIHLSSIPIIGKPPKTPINELTEVKPITPYHQSKLKSEEIISEIEDNDLNKIILRIPAPIGLYMSPERIVMRIIRYLKNGQNPLIYSDGSRVQNYLDIRDLAGAIQSLERYDKSNMFLIRGFDSISNVKLAEILIKESGTKLKVEFSKQVDVENDEKWIIDGTKVFNEIGYTPKHRIENSLKRVWESSNG
jgi:nucleoside-diphosphate-sugar epimerase